jgi:plasmid stabilization system protein ParE
MKYTVVWKPEAERKLATVWADATDRRSVSEAANEIDEQLRSNPESMSESRGGQDRLMLEPPLGVLYRISTQDRTVFVLTVWRFDRRGG